MDIHLNMKETIEFNELRVECEEKTTRANSNMTRRLQERLFKHYENIRRSKTYLIDMLSNHSFIKKLLKLQCEVESLRDISMYFDKEGNPAVMGFEDLAKFRIAEGIKTHSNTDVVFWTKLVCSTIPVEDKMYILREVLIDDNGDNYLFEIGLKSIIIDLLDGYKDVSAELLIIDSRVDTIRDKKKYERQTNELSLNLVANEEINCIYNVNVFKIGCGKLKDYYIDGRVLRKKRMSDEDLIALFETPVKQQPKKNKNKKVEIKKNMVVVESPVENNDSGCSSSDCDSDDNDSSCSGSGSDISGGCSSSDSDCNDSSCSGSFTRQLFKFGFSTKIWFVERTSIINMIYNLYDNNSVFKEFINNNEYIKINIIKGLHHDKNNTNTSLHITAVFYNGASYTKPYHLYVKDGAIVSMTEIRNLF